MNRALMNSRRLRLAGAAALLSAALSGTDAWAYRPFDFTDADVAKRHNFEVEFGPAEFVNHGGDHTLHAPNLVLNYGIGAGFELVVEGTHAVSLNSGPGGPGSRLEDVGASVKKVLRRGCLQDESGPSIATEEALLLPASGDPHAGASASLIASSSARPGTAHLNAEVLRTPQGQNGVACGLILEQGEEYGVSPVVELSLAAEQGSPPERTVLLGIIAVPRERLEYDLAFRFGQSEGQRLLEVRAGVTYQISARRLAERAAEVLGHAPRRRHRH